MYFCMDEIGFENEAKIKTISSESDRWKFLYDTALAYGFEGIHITPSLYDEFYLNLKNIPGYFKDFKLTLHLGGMYMVPEGKYAEFDRKMETMFDIAITHNIHDISIHPPYIHNLTKNEKNLTVELFHKIVNKWLKASIESGISLSLETHVSGLIFDGLKDFTKFIDLYPDIGVLIDISHNYYEPEYSEEEIIDILGSKNIKGLHISDAIRKAGFEKGTHLPIGNGTIDFSKLLGFFKKFPDLYGALEIKAPNEGIGNSLAKLKRITGGY